MIEYVCLAIATGIYLLWWFGEDLMCAERYEDLHHLNIMTAWLYVAVFSETWSYIATIALGLYALLEIWLYLTERKANA